MPYPTTMVRGNLSLGHQTFQTKRIPSNRAALADAGGLQWRLIRRIAIRRWKWRWYWWRRGITEQCLQCHFHGPGSEFERLRTVPRRQCLESGYLERRCRSELKRDHQFYWPDCGPSSRLRCRPLQRIEYWHSL